MSADSLLPHRWPGPPLFGVLVDRPNRFLARCIVGGQTISAHVPDRGRCLDLLVPGQNVVVVAATGAASSGRTTAFTLLLARAKTAPWPWVSVDPAGAPRLVAAAIDRGLLFPGTRVAGREIGVRHHGAQSRIDLLFADGTLCEVKSVGAARGGIALFPDAPTTRGVRHLALLAARARRGLRGAIVFCAQREDAIAVAPDSAIDPEFARALDRAASAGVVVEAIACSADPHGMRLLGPIPVLR